jgi:hypothetical protein
VPYKYLVAGDHSETLASGRPIAPGDELAADSVDLDSPHDQRLLADGVLIDTQTKKKEARRS